MMENSNIENSGNGSTDFTQTIDQSILNNLQSKAPAEQITTEDMVSYVPDDLTPEQKNLIAQQDFYSKNPSPGALPIEQYYPGINDPIAKGNYSGSVIGSTTLFAPGGGYMPFGVVAAREKAIQDAAMKRQMQLSQDLGKDFHAPITKHSSVQRHLNDLYYNGLQQWVSNAKKKYGTNWSDPLKNDVGFQKWNRSMNTLKEQEDYMVDRMATLQKEIQSGDFVATPELQGAMQDFLSGAKGLAQGPGNAKGYDLADSVLRFNTEYELNKVLNTAAKEMKYKVAETYGINPNDPNYDTIVSRKVKSMDEATLRDTAKRIKDELYPNSSYINENKIYSGLKSFFPGEQELQVQTVTKREPDGIDEKMDETSLSDQPSIGNVDFQMKKQGGKDVFQQEQVTGYYGATLKPISAVIEPGTRILYPRSQEGGMISQQNAKGAQKAVIGEVKVYETIDAPGTADDGRMVTAQWKERNPNGKTKHVPMAVGYFEEEKPVTKEKDGKKVPVTDNNGKPVIQKEKVPFYVPAEDIRNKIEKRDKSGYKSGYNVDLLNQKAQELDTGKKPYETVVDQSTNKAVIVKGGQQANKSTGTYTIKGKKYTLQDLTNMGYTADQVSQYKD
jgi:hypothetical protein